MFPVPPPKERVLKKKNGTFLTAFPFGSYCPSPPPLAKASGHLPCLMVPVPIWEAGSRASYVGSLWALSVGAPGAQALPCPALWALFWVGLPHSLPQGLRFLYLQYGVKNLQLHMLPCHSKLLELH